MKSMVKGLVALMFGTLLWMNGGLVKEAHAQQCLPGGFILQSGDQVYCNYSDGTCWTHDPYAIPPDCQARYEQRQRQTHNSSNSGFETPSRQKPSSYGAVAWDGKAGFYGSASKQVSKQAADELALRRCNSANCKIMMQYSNQCTAVAYGLEKGGTYFWQFSSGLTSSKAERAATAKCSKAAKNCKVLLSECSPAGEIDKSSQNQ